ncbi:MAG: transcription-repair coupling factor, partial [Bacteroidia bacterium]|nr:transcription-repair coupling factor [Bacteroidia bacterium]
EDVAELLRKICPDVHIGIGHAQMDNKQLEKVMLDFIGGEYGVLLCTTIVESGLDIPNANTMIINNAQNFGLSDLYQLRGRVGRSNRKAFCYLMAPPLSTITQEARKRLSAIEEFTDLGSGFNVALRDMDIRGAGNLLGAEQSGYISEMGFNMYHKILDEAIKELKEDEFKDLFENQKPKEFVNDCQIDTDLSILIPDAYVENISERLNSYNEINAQKDEEGLKQIKSRIEDRFGKSPIEVEELFDTVRLRWLATKLGFERIVIKNQVMNCYFVKNNDDYYNSDVFSSILQYVQTHPSGCEMKETAKSLILRINEIDAISIAIEKLSKMAGIDERKELIADSQ